MNALSQKEVGDYLNRFYVSSYQKISSFVIAGGAKQGGNVASYFCTPDGRVLHAVVGPVSAQKLLDEARWVEETWKLGEMYEIKTMPQLQALFRKAHLDRLAKEYGIRIKANQFALENPNATSRIAGPLVNTWLNQTADQQAKVHLLLAAFSAPKIARVYETVFERILDQKISTIPVVNAG